MGFWNLCLFRLAAMVSKPHKYVGFAPWGDPPSRISPLVENYNSSFVRYCGWFRNPAPPGIPCKKNIVLPTSTG